MSRDVVYVKYNTSDQIKYKYISIRVFDIKMSRDVVFLEYNTSDELKYNYTSIPVPDI